MSVKIKVSYTDETELAKLERKLAPDVKRCRPAKEKPGRRKRAYIEMKNVEEWQ